MTDPQSFIGRSEVQKDRAESDRFARLAATLDHVSPPWRPGVMPPLGHWLCFLPDALQSAIGEDGHPVRTGTGLLPNVDLPRRMWAGSRVRFLADVPLDSDIVRTSTVTAATPKEGRSGKMLFVTVRHEIAVAGGDTAIIEDQDIVYREAQPAGIVVERRAADPGQDDPCIRTIMPDPVLLFRYSALTFNGHRIHYDREYARMQEGYPGLVVHGPLLATLMLDHLLRELGGSVRSFDYRASAPTFDGEEVRLGFRRDGERAELRVLNPAGVAMTGTAELAS
ncbi:FAS1-like dehydratase domain-containing protein [Sphingosinithalassobacter portus]|uniref:FAS1-like dehydratase domain-containing protein n=1 Tax=Stakelama portus TaxID=2676234 RepID=UPI000D6E75A8|nr:MaoC family dehydratase N-terminal domain-containing protein [Sphingosinithalassobacter portus]